MKARELFDKIWDRYDKVYCSTLSSPIDVYKDDESSESTRQRCYWFYTYDNINVLDDSALVAIIPFESEVVIENDNLIITSDFLVDQSENLSITFYTHRPKLELSKELYGI